MSTNSLIAIPLAVFMGLGMSACDTDDGPAEEAGEELDDAMEKGGEQVERAGEKVEDATDR